MKRTTTFTTTVEYNHFEPGTWVKAASELSPLGAGEVRRVKACLPPQIPIQDTSIVFLEDLTRFYGNHLTEAFEYEGDSLKDALDVATRVVAQQGGHAGVYSRVVGVNHGEPVHFYYVFYTGALVPNKMITMDGGMAELAKEVRLQAPGA